MSLGPDVGSRVPHLGSWVSGPGSHPQDEFRVSGPTKSPGSRAPLFGYAQRSYWLLMF